MEGGGTRVRSERGEQMERRHRLGFPGDSDAAVEQPGEPGPADRRNFDDRVAPISVAASRGDDEGAEDRGSRPTRIQPGDRAACQLLVGAAARQDGDFGAFVVVLGSRLRSEAADYDAAAAIARYREKLSAARQFEDTPAAIMQNRRRRTPPPEG